MTITQCKTFRFQEYVMWSRGISRKSNMWKLQFPTWWNSSLGEAHFAENHTWIEPVVPKLYSNWKILKTIENKRNAIPFQAASHNQCSGFPTDPAWSQHIYTRADHNCPDCVSFNQMFTDLHLSPLCYIDEWLQ